MTDSTRPIGELLAKIIQKEFLRERRNSSATARLCLRFGSRASRCPRSVPSSEKLDGWTLRRTR